MNGFGKYNPCEFLDLGIFGSPVLHVRFSLSQAACEGNASSEVFEVSSPRMELNTATGQWRS